MTAGYETLVLRGRSEALRRFISEMPLERESIATFLATAAASLPPGARVADVGVGAAPYAEFFAHTDYVKIDWAESLHVPPGGLDIVASADALPVPDRSFDAVVLTQVLEHVANPAEVLAELHRVAREGGRLFLAAPLLWEEHEAPHDFFRYTRFGLEHLLGQAGFTDVQVSARTDCFSALAQLTLNARWAMGRAPDGRDGERDCVATRLEELADELLSFSDLDTSRSLTLGYAVVASRTRAAA